MGKNVDFLGNELNIDDNVVFINNESRKLQKGIVSGFTPQKCYILFRWKDGSRASTPTLHKCTDVVKMGG